MSKYTQETAPGVPVTVQWELLSKPRDLVAHRWAGVQWRHEHHIGSRLFDIVCVCISYGRRSVTVVLWLRDQALGSQNAARVKP